MSKNASFALKPRSVSLPEIVLLVTILLVVGTAFWAVICGGNREDEQLAVEHNLSKLRMNIERYRLDHNGRNPASLAGLIVATNRGGEPGGARSSAEFPFGPYLDSLPLNPLAEVGEDSPAAQRLSDSNGGWLYNPQTGLVSARQE